MKAVGTGPQRYCINFDPSPGFYSKLKLVLSSLLQEKMFLFPIDARLEGPLLHEPWLSRARVLHAQPSLTIEEYVANFVNFWATFSGYCTVIYLVLYLCIDPCTLTKRYSFWYIKSGILNFISCLNCLQWFFFLKRGLRYFLIVLESCLNERLEGILTLGRRLILSLQQ